MAVDHYENFPVASVLCPPRLREPVRAIYGFARTADDLADEGDATPAERLRDLAAYRADLDAVMAARPPSARWEAVFAALAREQRRFALPAAPLHALLDAFEQDVRNPPYATRADVLDYCVRSAAPVGRLLLHLYGVGDATALRQSDAVCTALQLVNFWQDLGVDSRRGRCYVPDADLLAHGVDRATLAAGRDTPATEALVASLCAWAGATMDEGEPLALRLPGRVGWELRAVVEGGRRVLHRMARQRHAVLTHRPRLALHDAPAIAWRMLRMAQRHARPPPASLPGGDRA